MESTVGPAPWYFASFPEIEVRGTKYVWRSRNTDEFCAILHPADDADRPVLMIGIYARVFALWPGLIGIWFTEESHIRVVALDPETFVEFPMVTSLIQSEYKQGKFICGAQPVAEFSIRTNLDEGEHRLDFHRPSEQWIHCS